MPGETFIWTEALGCGEILPPMLNSYLAHHFVPINVFIYEEDLPLLPRSNRIIPQIVSNSSDSIICRKIIEQDFKSGHSGTARLWARLIKLKSPKTFIHLDSDTIFLGNVIDELESKVVNSGIVGTRRPYRHTQSRNGFRKIRLFFARDAINTHCFAFKNEDCIFDEKELMFRILGRNRPFLRRILSPVQDFFDDYAFYIMKKSGVWYLDSSKQSRSGTHNRFGEFERRMISFAAVGSGCSIYYGRSNPLSRSYGEFAVSSFALYSKYLLQKEVDAEPLQSDYLKNLLERLDLTSWTLK